MQVFLGGQFLSREGPHEGTLPPVFGPEGHLLGEFGLLLLFLLGLKNGRWFELRLRRRREFVLVFFGEALEALPVALPLHDCLIL